MLSKKVFLNLLLLVIFIALATAVLNTEQADTDLPLLSATDMDDVRTITIRHGDNSTVIERRNRGWYIIQPAHVGANGIRITALLRLLSAPVHSSYALADIDPKAIGLEGSRNSIRFDSQHFTFGQVNPATGLRYISDGENVYTIEDVYYPLINSHFSTLVSFSLIDEDTVIDKLALPGLTISKDSMGRWQSSIDMTADEVASILQDWRSVQAFGVRQYIGRDSLGEIRISRQGGTQMSFSITDTDPWLILARPELDLEYHLEKGTLSKLTGGDITELPPR